MRLEAIDDVDLPVREGDGDGTQHVEAGIGAVGDDDQAHPARRDDGVGERGQARRVAKAAADATIDALVRDMLIIPPSPDVVAETLRIWTVKNLPPFDEMVLGAVVAKAAELHRNGEREIFFCNLNKSDFSPHDRGGMAIARPNLEAEYARCGLIYLSSFDVPP